MSTELSSEVSPEIISSILLTGDISKLSPTQRISYYNGMCKTLGLNPLTQPFVIVKFKGKETLYATKGCTQQLSDVRKINTEVTNRERFDTVYMVTCRATMGDGRYTDEDGAMSLMEPDKIKQGDNWVTNPKAGKHLVGEDLANAMMKAVTKAKRRAVLALSGLGLQDESEISEERHPAAIDNGKSRVENIIDSQVEQQEFIKQEDLAKEVKDEPKEETKPKAEEKQPEKSEKTKSKKDGKEGVETSPVVATVNPFIIGLIDNQLQGENGEIIAVKISSEPIMNPNTNKSDIKYSFLIEDKYYGTWDANLGKQIMDCVDNRRMVKFEYKERKNEKGKAFQDIVSFKEATVDEVNP